jgi:LmbE family N-acetylglucosaminyl deacetylase
VDVSDVYEQKRGALQAYRSQFGLAGGADTVATPLTNGYLERVEARDSLLAQGRGWAYAEGFAIKRPFGISSF